MSKWETIPTGNTSSGQLLADEMILLSDGTVLIHNANTGSPNPAQPNLASASASQWLRMSPDKNGKYENPSWSPTITMATAREFFASGMMRNGRVFVVGGETSTDTANTNNTGLDSPLGEVFDPVTNKWTPLSKPGTFSYIQGDVAACVLADGRVLMGALSTPQTAIWNPAYNTWTAAGTGAAKTVTPNEETWTLLPDGSVLTVDVFSAGNAAERYIPATDAWGPAGPGAPPNLALPQVTSPNPLIGTRPVNEIGPAVLLPNGTVFAIGATGQTGLYNTATGWSVGPSFPPDNSPANLWPTLTAIDAPACLLPNGKLVCLGGVTVPSGSGFFSNNVQFLEFDPSSNAATIPLLDKQPGNQVANATTFTWHCWFLLLPTGQLLCSATQTTLYLYTPDGGPQPGWKPTITSVPTTLATGETYTITGTQLNGLSQAVSYGDDGQMATNYPLVQITNNATNPPTVAYLRTFNFSSLGVAVPGPVSADFQVPCDLPPGPWQLRVIVNGIASDPVPVTIVTSNPVNPFNFQGVIVGGNQQWWLHTDPTSDGGNDLGDDITLGQNNHLDNLTNGNPDTDDTNTTQIVNIAGQNATLSVLNGSSDSGAVGLFGRSGGCSGSIGVAGAAVGWGVAGAAVASPVDVLNNSNAPDFTPYPSNVGVFGVGDKLGVYGQNRISENQKATSLPAPGNVGVYGVGDAVGVQGDNDQLDPTGANVGTGVTGTSIQGVGVLGQGVGSANPSAPVTPYIGVCGVSQASPAPTYPPNQEYLATGVVGLGDTSGVVGVGNTTGVIGTGNVRGGKFETTPSPAATTFANVQLTPLRLPPIEEELVQVYAPTNRLTQLPRNGEPGDIIALHATDGNGQPSVEVWVCIRPRNRLGAAWARIHYDTVVTTL